MNYLHPLDRFHLFHMTCRHLKTVSHSLKKRTFISLELWTISALCTSHNVGKIQKKLILQKFCN